MSNDSSPPDLKADLARRNLPVRLLIGLLTRGLRECGFEVTLKPSPLRKGRWLKPLVSVLILEAAAVGVLRIALAPQPTKDPPRNSAPPLNVRVEVIRPEPLVPESYKLPAVVEANRVVTVSAEVAGRVETLHGLEGAAVHKGDKIISLDTELYRAEFDRVTAQLAFDMGELERVQGLAARKILTEKELDQAKNNVTASRSRLRVAKYNLDKATVEAPIQGVLDRIPVEKGEYVQPGTPVAKIVDVDTMKVVVQVPERDVAFLRLGQEAEVTALLRDEPVRLTGKVSYISELADEQTRATRVEIDIDNRQRRLRSGQIVDVDLVRGRHQDAVMVPLDAVIPLESGYAVFVVENGQARLREVKLGFMKGRRVRVVEGLRAGDLLIVAGHRFVGPGQKVTVVQELEKAPPSRPVAVPGR